ncbi:hypothetical protein DFH09DRAFT_1067540 [Mycena vulgaris]|nr:hypothetical protein DFH09DRAFT_1067540 [Mycena vulgaris]
MAGLFGEEPRRGARLGALPIFKPLPRPVKVQFSSRKYWQMAVFGSEESFSLRHGIDSVGRTLDDPTRLFWVEDRREGEERQNQTRFVGFSGFSGLDRQRPLSPARSRRLASPFPHPSPTSALRTFSARRRPSAATSLKVQPRNPSIVLSNSPARGPSFEVVLRIHMLYPLYSCPARAGTLCRMLWASTVSEKMEGGRGWGRTERCVDYESKERGTKGWNVMVSPARDTRRHQRIGHFGVRKDKRRG